VASFRATSIDGLKSKTRVLARQGRGLTAGEIIERNGDLLNRLATSVVHDALAIFGADYDAEPAAATPE